MLLPYAIRTKYFYRAVRALGGIKLPVRYSFSKPIESMADLQIVISRPCLPRIDEWYLLFPFRLPTRTYYVDNEH